MKRGRPAKSRIREKITSILLQIGTGYGYEIYKIYRHVFGNVNMRNLYYNLKKGAEEGEFIILDIKKEEGSFTWGDESRHIYYAVGPYGKPYELNEKERLRLNEYKRREYEIDWDKEIRKQIEMLKREREDALITKEKGKYEDFVLKRNKIERKCEALKEWMRAKFDRVKAHELRVEIDKIKEGLIPQTPSFPMENKTQDVEENSEVEEKD